MPVRKKKNDDSKKEILNNPDGISNNSSANTSNQLSPHMRMPTHYFHCQLAHGSPTGRITGFRSIKELYEKIAECYNISSDDILFCTLNTHKIDMNCLLGAQICLDDFIFAHIKGQKKEVVIIKEEESLGLTITDNGNGRAFIKRIRESSPISKLGQGLIDVGDHIEKVDNEYFVNKRHYDIASKLRSISVKSKFTLRLISPEKSIYSNISKRTEHEAKPKIISGKGVTTIRMHAGNVYEYEDTSSNMDHLAIEAISRLVEKALGISDSEMAQTIMDIGKRVRNPADFNEQMNEELGDFHFPNDLIYDFWGVITDANAGLLTPSQPTQSEFYEDRL